MYITLPELGVSPVCTPGPRYFGLVFPLRSNDESSAEGTEESLGSSALGAPAMASADDILLAALRQTGAPIAEDAASLRELDAQQVYAACAACLNALNHTAPEELRFPPSLPTNPGMRFRACTNLANAISALGYAEELGFNHFLYPSTRASSNPSLTRSHEW